MPGRGQQLAEPSRPSPQRASRAAAVSSSWRSISLSRLPPWPARSRVSLLLLLAQLGEPRPSAASARARLSDLACSRSPICCSSRPALRSAKKNRRAAPLAGQAAVLLRRPCRARRSRRAAGRATRAGPGPGGPLRAPWSGRRSGPPASWSTRSASNGSSMWLRTKSFRLPTDFIDTVWWNRSMACSDSMPRRRRKSFPYSGKWSWMRAPAARSRFFSAAMSVPKSGEVALGSTGPGRRSTKNRSGCPLLPVAQPEDLGQA